MKPTALMARLVLPAALLLVPAGCQKRPQFAAVEGTVTLDGKPLPEVEVIFLADPARNTVGPRSAAYTNAEGRFHLRADTGEDGAVAGTYRVCFSDPRALVAEAFLPPPRPTGTGRAPPEPAPRVPTRQRSRVLRVYTDLTTTPFKDVAVVSGPNTLTFDLKSR